MRRLIALPATVAVGITTAFFPAVTAPAHAGGGSATQLDGTYVTSISKAQYLAAHPAKSEIGPENWGEWKLVLKPNRFVQTKLNEPDKGSVTAGKLTVVGSKLTLRPDPADVWVYSWKLSSGGKTLTLRKLKLDEPTGFVATTWRRIG